MKASEAAGRVQLRVAACWPIFSTCSLRRMETVMNCSMQTGSFRTRAVAIPSVAALLLALVATTWAEPGNDNRAPELEGETEKVAVEAGHKVAAHAYAVGYQVYRWNGTSWSFVGPE